MIKGLIAVDLDGTLLDKNGRYSPLTRDVFRLLSSRGYAIVLASGRPYRSMENIYHDLGLNAPVICYNGALLFHPLDPSFTPKKAWFEAGDIISLYQQTKGYVGTYMAESFRRIYINKADAYLDRYFPYAGMEIVEGPFEQTLSEPVYTCLFSCPEGLHETLRLAVMEHPRLSWRSWSDSLYSELFTPGVDKGSALRELAEYYGVGKEDVYAFGDASNDLEMLLSSGHPFVMKGSRLAKITPDLPETKNPVEEDGVAETLVRLFRL